MIGTSSESNSISLALFNDVLRNVLLVILPECAGDGVSPLQMRMQGG